jgi:1-acyl-sn-glycerol-3-phosphate acyltransferase
MLFMTVTAFCAVIAMVLLPFHPRIMRRFIQLWARLIIWMMRLVCNIRVDVTGLENIAPGAAIIASKHNRPSIPLSGSRCWISRITC